MDEPLTLGTFLLWTFVYLPAASVLLVLTLWLAGFLLGNFAVAMLKLSDRTGKKNEPPPRWDGLDQ